LYKSKSLIILAAQALNLHSLDYLIAYKGTGISTAAAINVRYWFMT
jgi:hypothetical protein